MSDKSSEVPFALLEGLAGAGTAIATPLATTNPVSFTLAGVVAATAPLLRLGYDAHRNRRAHEWWRLYVLYVGQLTDEGAVTEAALFAEKDNEELHERLYEALNALWAAVDQRVLPHLAYLAAHYQAAGEPADAFYKSFARFLQDSTHEEVEHLRSLLVAARDALSASNGAPRATLVPMKRQQLEVGYLNSDEARTRHEIIGVSSDIRTVTRRLLYLHLADEVSADGAASSGIALSLDQIEQLSKFVAPALTEMKP